jgi:hypothetical protein
MVYTAGGLDLHFIEEGRERVEDLGNGERAHCGHSGTDTLNFLGAKVFQNVAQGEKQDCRVAYVGRGSGGFIHDRTSTSEVASLPGPGRGGIREGKGQGAWQTSPGRASE